MRTIVLLTIFTMLFGCNSEEIIKADDLYTGFEFSVVDNQGNDLLNPENQNYLSHSNIKLFYKENGQYKEVYNANLDYPRNFLIFKHKTEYRIRIFLNDSENETQPEKMIQWNENKSNIIKAEFYRTNSLVRFNKVWLDDNLIWDYASNSEPYYKLIE